MYFIINIAMLFTIHDNKSTKTFAFSFPTPPSNHEHPIFLHHLNETLIFLYPPSRLPQYKITEYLIRFHN